jgi:inorganic triphosphatase YgiF
VKPELEKAPSESLRHLLREAGETLRPVAKFRVKRTSWEINGHASTIEISLDRGVVSAGGSTRELNELELELKHGSQKALFDLCRTIAKRVPLRLEVLSKAELAEAMTEGRLEKPRKAPRVHLRPEMTVAEGFTQIVLSCLRHFRLNEDLLVTRRDPEALHQLHVALRRLHSAFLLFRPVVRGGRCRRHTRQMQRFGSMLGRARNLDTFIGLDEPHEAPRKVIRRRNAAYDKVIETLDSPRVPRLFLSILRWLFVGKWRLRSVADAPLEAFIAWRLEQSWTRLVHQRAPTWLEAEQEGFCARARGPSGAARTPERSLDCTAAGCRDGPLAYVPSRLKHRFRNPEGCRACLRGAD